MDMLFVTDIGTTSLKAALFNTDGRLEKKTSVPIGFLPTENRTYHEADPLQWIAAVGQAYRELSEGKKLCIEAVAVSGNGPTLVAVDKDDTPIGNAVSWMDRRGVAEANMIKESSGYYVDPTFYLPKALWLRNNKPREFERVRHFLACPEYLIHFLTGEAHTILPGDNFLRYFWTDDLLKQLHVDKSLFPPFINPGDLCGEVTASASRELGIPAGTPVFAGGPDFVMSLLGTATVFPGRACDRAGTSEGINLCTENLVQDERLMGYGHVVKGLYNVSGIISTSGKALEWIMGLLGMEEQDYDSVFRCAAASKPGARGLIFLPYLTGERAPHWDPALRGCFFGLSLFHEKEDVLRAVLESTGYAMRDVIEAIEENDVDLEDLRITGNPSKSSLWNRIKADITGRPIHVPEFPESELLGDACTALKGIGRFQELQEAAESVVVFREVIEPMKETKQLYQELFDVYRQVYSGTKEAAHKIFDIQNTEEL